MYPCVTPVIVHYALLHDPSTSGPDDWVEVLYPNNIRVNVYIPAPTFGRQIRNCFRIGQGQQRKDTDHTCNNVTINLNIWTIINGDGFSITLTDFMLYYFMEWYWPTETFGLQIRMDKIRDIRDITVSSTEEFHVRQRVPSIGEILHHTSTDMRDCWCIEIATAHSSPISPFLHATVDGRWKITIFIS